jgi:hypothetical protein
MIFSSLTVQVLVSIEWNLLKSLLILPLLLFLITNYIVTDDAVHRIKLSIYIV